MLQNKCYMVKGIVFLLYIGMNSGNGGYLYLLFCFKKKNFVLYLVLELIYHEKLR